MLFRTCDTEQIVLPAPEVTVPIAQCKCKCSMNNELFSLYS